MSRASITRLDLPGSECALCNKPARGPMIPYVLEHPALPTGREPVAICGHCERTLGVRAHDPILVRADEARDSYPEVHAGGFARELLRRLLARLWARTK